ncbi:asparaginase [Kordiimonas sp. SCSIO 12610]|uniref:asparaginase n=1 Tax=Kordiimonas sp. SCSIO 12610 TaxID=2829597 RepID=UPI00210CB950|nr:asparaginase [Kordiimonas sp. SCSIO 12610]UTW56791.1 asparaginase [Kordiimonas sp. SCSIO 12610]
MNDLPLIDVYALGGTIAMTPDQLSAGQDKGVSPTLTAEDLVNSVPGLDQIASVRAETISNVASANLDFATIKNLSEKARMSDADAIIVTQGTDTMEETSFLMKLIYQGDKPIIFTGAMRSPNQLSSDGPANLYAAILTAISISTASVYVVMNNEIHDPVLVQKSHTWALDAFQSDGGACGYVSEQQVFWHKQGIKIDDVLREDLIFVDDIAPVACLPICLDDGGLLLDDVGKNYQGLVIDTYGAGHVSELWATKLKELARQIPVVIASQAYNGRVLENTYGYVGAEIDLFSNGMISAGILNAKKARILISLIISKKTENVNKSFTQIVETLVTIR